MTAVHFPPTTNAPIDGTFIKIAAGKSWYWDGLCWLALSVPAPAPSPPGGGTGTGTSVVGATVSPVAPTTPAIGSLWLNSTKTPPELRVFDGSQWVLSVPIDDISITDDYGPIQAGKIDSGNI